MPRSKLGADPLADLAAPAAPAEPRGRGRGREVPPTPASTPAPKRKTGTTAPRSPRPATSDQPPASPASPEPAPTGASLTTLETRFEEALREVEGRLAGDGALAAGTRRRLEEEMRLFGTRMAERLETLRPAEDRERRAIDSARQLLTVETLLRLATRRWLDRRSLVVDAFGFDPVGARSFEPLVRLLVERWFRATVRGVEAVPDEGPAILVANHAGAIPFDGLVLSHVVRRRHPRRRDVRWLVENEAHHFPFFGTLMARLGAVRACPENARLLLDRGAVVAVFPEGNQGLRKTFRERYRLQRFGRGGVVKLALRARVPVVPVGIVGGEETYPVLWRTGLFAEMLGVPFLPITPTFPCLGPLGLLPLPTRWRIAVGPALHFDDLPSEAADDPVTVSRVNERVRGEVQRLVGDLLGRRPGVFW